MPPSSLPPSLGGRYRPIRHLGSGGMGSVFLVEHLRTGERLALKLLRAQARLNEDALERFRREARIAVRLKSEHVVRVVDADVAEELEGAPFLVMELLEGSDLGALANQAPQPAAHVVEWLRQAARALDRAHAAGVVHHDLKPENLFLTRRDDGSPLVKVLDFGVAKILEANESDRTRTASGTVFGTPLYMAPEQALGRSEAIGPPADCWALAMVAYRLLTGEFYWKGETRAHILAQLVYEPVVPPSAHGHRLGEAFDRWFLRSCRPNPGSRWPSTGVQIEALAEAFGQAPATRAPSTPPERPSLAEAPAPTASASPPAITTADTVGAFDPAATPDLRTTAAAHAPPPAFGRAFDEGDALRPPALDQTPSQPLDSFVARTSAPPPPPERRRLAPLALALAVAGVLAAVAASRSGERPQAAPPASAALTPPPSPSPSTRPLASADAALAEPFEPDTPARASAADRAAKGPPPPARAPHARPKPPAPPAGAPKPAPSPDPWDRD